jgi:hypothetical protein
MEDREIKVMMMVVVVAKTRHRTAEQGVTVMTL